MYWLTYKSLIVKKCIFQKTLRNKANFEATAEPLSKKNPQVSWWYLRCDLCRAGGDLIQCRFSFWKGLGAACGFCGEIKEFKTQCNLEKISSTTSLSHECCFYCRIFYMSMSNAHDEAWEMNEAKIDHGSPLPIFSSSQRTRNVTKNTRYYLDKKNSSPIRPPWKISSQNWALFLLILGFGECWLLACQQQ